MYTQVATENLGRQYYLAHGVPVVIARFFIQVGVGGTDTPYMYTTRASSHVHGMCMSCAQVGVGGTDTLAIHEFCKQVMCMACSSMHPMHVCTCASG